MGIAPAQPENVASTAIYQTAQLAVFGNGSPGWHLAAYQAAGLPSSPAPGPGGTWPAVRIAWGFENSPAIGAGAGSRSRVGGFSAGTGMQVDATDTRRARRLKVVLPVLLSGQSGTTIGGTIDPGDGLGARVLKLTRGDRLVVPASLLHVEGINGGDAVITIESAVSDGAMWLGEGRF